MTKRALRIVLLLELAVALALALALIAQARTGSDDDDELGRSIRGAGTTIVQGEPARRQMACLRLPRSSRRSRSTDGAAQAASSAWRLRLRVRLPGKAGTSTPT
jgi:hypothetical protein